MKFILCIVQVLVMANHALAWQSVSEFETGIVGALSNNLVLTSRAFSDSLTNFIVRPFNDETGMAARIVNGVRVSRLYVETMDEGHLDKARLLQVSESDDGAKYKGFGRNVGWIAGA